MLCYSYECRAANILDKNNRQQSLGICGQQLGTRNCAEWLVAWWLRISLVLPTKYETLNCKFMIVIYCLATYTNRPLKPSL